MRSDFGPLGDFVELKTKAGLPFARVRQPDGADTLAFDSALDAVNNVDTILDFVSGTDKVELKASVFTGIALGSLGTVAFGTGTAATTADQRIVYGQGTGNLYFDADGVGGTAAALFATLTTKPTIAAADFYGRYRIGSRLKRYTRK